MKVGLLLFGLSFFIFSCKKELTAKEIVEASIEHHGGLDHWNKLKELSFEKTTTLFYEDGSVESHSVQNQTFTFNPRPVYKLKHKQDTATVSLIWDDEYVHKMVNGFPVQDSTEIEKARNSILAAHYVIKQPFDLVSDNAELELKGDTLLGNKRAFEVAVEYAGDTPISDRWSYFIDAETFEVLANKVILQDHSSWVENLTFDTSTGFKFNAHRKSYRLDSIGKKAYLRAEYFYKDFRAK